MSSPWTFSPSSSSARPSPISSMWPPRQAERGTSLYSPATEPGGEGFCAPASGGSRANSACSGTPPTVPATAPSRTVARERPRAAAAAARLAGQARRLEAQLAGLGAVRPPQADELPRLAQVDLLAQAGLALGDVVAAGDRGLRLLPGAGGEHERGDHRDRDDEYHVVSGQAASGHSPVRA